MKEKFGKNCKSDQKEKSLENQKITITVRKS